MWNYRNTHTTRVSLNYYLSSWCPFNNAYFVCWIVIFTDFHKKKPIRSQWVSRNKLNEWIQLTRCHNNSNQLFKNKLCLYILVISRLLTDQTLQIRVWRDIFCCVALNWHHNNTPTPAWNENNKKKKIPIQMEKWQSKYGIRLMLILTAFCGECGSYQTLWFIDGLNTRRYQVCVLIELWLLFFQQSQPIILS